MHTRHCVSYECVSADQQILCNDRYNTAPYNFIMCVQLVILLAVQQHNLFSVQTLQAISSMKRHSKEFMSEEPASY